jgi:hypothetical protein
MRDLKIKSKSNLKPCGTRALNVIYSLRAKFKFLCMEGVKTLKFIKHNTENPTCHHVANHSREFPVNVHSKASKCCQCNWSELLSACSFLLCTWSSLGHSFSHVIFPFSHKPTHTTVMCLPSATLIFSFCSGTGTCLLTCSCSTHTVSNNQWCHIVLCNIINYVWMLFVGLSWERAFTIFSCWALGNVYAVIICDQIFVAHECQSGYMHLLFEHKLATVHTMFVNIVICENFKNLCGCYYSKEIGVPHKSMGDLMQPHS